jgi:hypothetical protein
MLCSDAKLDSHRFKDIIDEAIASGNNITIFCWCKFELDICSAFSIGKEIYVFEMQDRSPS